MVGGEGRGGRSGRGVRSSRNGSGCRGVEGRPWDMCDRFEGAGWRRQDLGVAAGDRGIGFKEELWQKVTSEGFGWGK